MTIFEKREEQCERPSAGHTRQDVPVRIRPIADIRHSDDTEDMANPLNWLKKLLSRWSRQQETALSQLTEGRTASRRIGSYAKSERIEAKFFLLALAPFGPVMASDQMGWTRSDLWHAWFWLSVVWAVAIVGVGFATLLRAFRRSLHRKR